ncbi:hypothetical protein AAC387_Pa07g2442 [Persea americana]
MVALADENFQLAIHGTENLKCLQLVHGIWEIQPFLPPQISTSSRAKPLDWSASTSSESRAQHLKRRAPARAQLDNSIKTKYTAASRPIKQKKTLPHLPKTLWLVTGEHEIGAHKMGGSDLIILPKSPHVASPSYSH